MSLSWQTTHQPVLRLVLRKVGIDQYASTRYSPGFLWKGALEAALRGCWHCPRPDRRVSWAASHGRSIHGGPSRRKLPNSRRASPVPPPSGTSFLGRSSLCRVHDRQSQAVCPAFGAPHNDAGLAGPSGPGPASMPVFGEVAARLRLKRNATLRNRGPLFSHFQLNENNRRAQPSRPHRLTSCFYVFCVAVLSDCPVLFFALV